MRDAAATEVVTGEVTDKAGVEISIHKAVSMDGAIPVGSAEAKDEADGTVGLICKDERSATVNVFDETITNEWANFSVIL
jgi:hypothetical protein